MKNRGNRDQSAQSGTAGAQQEQTMKGTEETTQTGPATEAVTGPQTPEAGAVAAFAASSDVQPQTEAVVEHVPAAVVEPVAQQAASAKLNIGERNQIMKLARDLSAGAQALMAMIGQTPKIARNVSVRESSAKRSMAAKPSKSAKRAAKRATKSAKSNSAVGRVASLYVATGKDPKHLTEATGAFYKAIKGRKHGISAAEIASKTGISTGTVGWGLGKLQQQGAVKRVSA